MKARGAAVQGTLALLGLAAAYATWQRPGDKATGGDVVIFDLARSDLERVRYEDGPKLIELERREEGTERGLWLHLATREAAGDRDAVGADAGFSGATSDRSGDAGVVAERADGGTPAADRASTAAPPRETKLPDREVRANDTAEKLFDRFAPLRASRSLGVLDDAKRRELGLESSRKRLEVFARGGRHASYVMAVSALGAGAPYLQSDQDKRVYLLSGSIATDLDAASTRLVDRRLHLFKPSDYDALLVKVDDRQRDLLELPAEGSQPQKLASTKTPTKPDEFARNWHDRIWRLVVTEVLGRAEVPSSGDPKVAIRIDYRYRQKPVGWIEVSQPRPATSGPVPEIYARTEHTAGWVKVHAIGEDLVKEGKKVVAEP